MKKTKQANLQSSFECLEQVLCEVPEYAIEDKLNKNLIAELARKYDSGLINKLLSNSRMKKLFFVETDAGMMFRRDTFLRFISQKEFLPDSYTRFSQKIGLAVGDNYLADDSRVVLDWPYKDCVLEGGQTKEDQKRDEVFFNEVLAPDQINTILADKVFTNWKRYDKDGEHELDKLKSNDNLIIKGNNLVVLHSLKKRFAGKIKLIYIDPPYNTKNDSFGYNDTFNHSTWLTFMKNRLDIAWKLLKEGGCFFIQCDDNEQAYLKVLCDEVFGEKNFRNTIAIKMSEASGTKMAHERIRYPKLKEYIHFYTKGQFPGFEYIDKCRSGVWDDENNIFLSGMTEELRRKMGIIENSELEDNEKIKKLNLLLSQIKTVPLSQKISKLGSSDNKDNWLFDNSFRIIKTAGSSSIARQLKEKYKESPGEEEQDIKAEISAKGILYYYITHFNRDTASPRVQVLFADSNAFINPCDFWQDIKTTGAIANEGGVQLKKGKKPEKLIWRIIKMCTKPGDIVMDYHLGSGTTAAVAHKMGRQYIGVEQLNYGDNDSVTRLQNVINGDTTGVSKAVGWKGGGSFVYCNIKNDANVFRESVKDADEKELDKLLDEVLKSSFLSYRVDPKKVTKSEFNKLSKAEKKRVLMELVDNNTLYLNYSEIDDKTYKISDADKKHNKEFYGEK